MDVSTLKVWTTLYAAKAREGNSIPLTTLAELTSYPVEEVERHLAGLIRDSLAQRRLERGATPEKNRDLVWLTDEGVKAFDDYVAELRKIAQG